MAAVGILLAAGRGRRFDPSGERNKLMTVLPDHGQVVVASARTLMSVVGKVIAVVPPDDGGVGAALEAAGCDVTVCADADDGMAASLVHAVRHSLPGAQAWVIALGDMPYVRAGTIQALCAAIEGGAPIAVPVCGGRRGNPVVFGAAHLQALLALEGDQGARAILLTNPVVEVEVDDNAIFADIDTPLDLIMTS